MRFEIHENGIARPVPEGNVETWALAAWISATDMSRPIGEVLDLQCMNAAVGGFEAYLDAKCGNDIVPDDDKEAGIKPFRMVNSIPLVDDKQVAVIITDWSSEPLRPKTGDYSKAERMIILATLDAAGVEYKKGCGCHTLHAQLIEAAKDASPGMSVVIELASKAAGDAVEKIASDDGSQPVPPEETPDPSMNTDEAIGLARRYKAQMDELGFNGEKAVNDACITLGAVSEGAPYVKLLKPDQVMKFAEILRGALSRCNDAVEADKI